MIGSGTARRDDPLLTCRVRGGKTPLRVVLDSRARLSLGSRLVQTAGQSPVLVACDKAASARRVDALRKAGCSVARVPGVAGKLSLRALMRLLCKKEITHVLVEGGSKVLGSAFDEGLVDRVAAFVSPKIAGGTSALTAVGGRGVKSIQAALRLENVRTRRFGSDTLIEGDVASP